MASSSFLAIFALVQLAIDEGSEYPHAVDALKRDIYVDDVVTGAESVESALELQSEIINILGKGCFELRKWTSNCPRLLENLDPEQCHHSALRFDSEPTSPVKVLDMEWNPSGDVFTFIVLLELARIFDPFGFLMPLTLTFKHIMHEIWTLGLDWDDAAFYNICQKWLHCRLDLDMLSSLEILRFVLSKKCCNVLVHDFYYVSEEVYSAVVFFRVRHGDGSIAAHLIKSRSNIAPFKTTSIPRMELCSAILLANLVAHIKDIFSEDVLFKETYCWYSTVTLAWLRSPSQLCRAHCNPTDCGFRRVTVRELVNHPLWWTGPTWLALDINNWPESFSPFEEREDDWLVPKQTSLFVSGDQFDDFFSSRHFSLNKAKRIVAYTRRFVHNCRKPGEKQIGLLVESELDDVLNNLIKFAQENAYANQITLLQDCKKLPKQIRRLSVSIDESGLLRVGGILDHSELVYAAKAPISNRWQLVQKLHRNFWKRWHMEYLHTLNQRSKWHSGASEPKIGALVIIKDEQLKPLNWSLGRILNLHPGNDGISHVATVKSQSGCMLKPLVKLCPLPID